MPVFESLISGTAVSIVEQVLKGGKYAAKEIRDAYKKVDDFQRLKAASDAYIDNYFNRHCQIKILPWLTTEPLELESIYTDVKILDAKSIKAFMGSEALETAYREKGTRSFGNSKEERLNGMTVANDKSCLMVLGGPGIGKSTFLRKIGLEALKKDGALKRECIPVFLELKKFREKTVDIRQKIIEEFETCNFPAAAAFVDVALEQGKLLVLFDGLDEVPSTNLIQVIEKIEDFVDQHSREIPNQNTQNSFVASCRIAAYRSSFRRFTDVTISEFDDGQIKQFIHRWFDAEEDKALKTGEKYLTLLNQSEHIATKELAQTPLLLTFLCLIYDREQALPHERTTLYGSALNIILKEWSAQKRINPDPIYQGLHPALEEVMLAEIAYDSFKEDQLFFSKDTITSRITAFLTDMLDAPKCLNADAVLTAIEVQQGILVERATDAYSFSHLTLQEYLTALHIVENHLENDLVTQHLVDDSWREIFLLVSGLMKNRVMTLLLAIDQQARGYIEPYPKLQALVQWAEVNKLGASELYQRAAVISIASAFASASASDRDSARDSASAIACASACASARDSASAIDSAFDSASACASAIDSARDSASDFARDSASAIAFASAINFSSAIASGHHFLNTYTFSSISAKLSQHQAALPNETDSAEAWRTWADNLTLIWIEALELNQESISFSSPEATAWKDYLYANELLLRCKESAIRVSRTEWEKLEKRLLTFDPDSALN